MASTTPNHPETANQEDIMKTDVAIAEVEKELSELMEEDSNLLGGSDVEELLERLSNANNMAKDMENKIDNVLENLDNLLAMLNKSEGKQDPPTKDLTGNSGQDQGSSSA